MFPKITNFGKKRKQMQYQHFREQFEPLGVFSVNDVLKTEKHFDSKQLVWWQDKGYLRKIINRWYCFADIKLSEQELFFIANKIYSPSYISFESALSRHGLIPEGVYSITSATSLKTNSFKTPIGSFSYRHLKPELMFGYKLIPTDNAQAKIAEPEKAILDYLYLNQKINTPDEFFELRINVDTFETIITKKHLYSYLTLFKNKSLESRVEALLKFIKHA